jgi:L-asparaginase
VSTTPVQPQVCVISLGGTIASARPLDENAGTGVVPRLDSSDLVAGVAEQLGAVHIESVDFRQVPGGDLTLADVVALAHEIGQRRRQGATGVVVTQGTDTIEESSFALDLLLGERTVVVTGAMRPAAAVGRDGPANLLAAIAVATSDHAGLGSVVVFNDEVHAARFVQKTHASNPATFRSPASGPLGIVVEGRTLIRTRLPRLLGRPGAGVREVPPVALVECAIGDDPRLLRGIEDLGYEGVVVAAFGAGHVPRGHVAVLADLATRIPVVLASRTGDGEILRSTYGFVGSESDLLARGLIAAGALDARKARVLLSLHLAANANLGSIRDAFDEIDRSMSGAGDG